MEFLNLYNKNTSPKRVVVLGSNGFIASAVLKHLDILKIDTLNISRDNFNLEDSNAVNKLSELIDIKDTILFIAANAPVKNNDMFLSNILICKNICQLLEKKSINHLIYISSDAIYKDSMKPLNEDSCAEPSSLHGLMHLSREIMLKNSYNGPYCILRPTLVYGLNDPHNGYGPNSFYRKALKNQNLNIFGKGEELRDHVDINDVAKLITLLILRKSIGNLNIASGKVISFLAIAKNIINHTNSKSKINYLSRVSEMPHNGYRAFDVDLIKKNFPDMNLNNVFDGIINMINDGKK